MNNRRYTKKGKLNLNASRTKFQKVNNKKLSCLARIHIVHEVTQTTVQGHDAEAMVNIFIFKHFCNMRVNPGGLNTINISKSFTIVNVFMTVLRICL